MSKAKYWITIMCLIAVCILFCVWGCIERKETGILRQNITDLNGTITALRKLEEEQRTEITGLERTIEEGESINRELEQRIERIEEGHRQALESIRRSQNISGELTEIDRQFGEENTEFAGDIGRIAELLEKILAN